MITETQIKILERYCSDPITRIENYEQAISDKQKWECHHKLEIKLNIGRKELIAMGLYWFRPAGELILLTKKEHNRIHFKGKPLSEEHKRKLREAAIGKKMSEEARRKMSKAKKGKPSNHKGKPHSEEARRQISEALKGNTYFKGKTHSEESKEKNRQSHLGKTFSKEHKQKLSKAKKGKHWYNNGEIELLCNERPSGFVPGRLK